MKAKDIVEVVNSESHYSGDIFQVLHVMETHKEVWVKVDGGLGFRDFELCILEEWVE